MTIAMAIERIDESFVSVVQDLLEASQTYSMNTDGVPVAPGDGMETFTALPPGCGPHQKNVLLLKYEEQPIGVVDVIDGFPDVETAFIGLFVLREDFQGQGLGRQFYRRVESWICNHLKSSKIRLAVVDSNPVVPFWVKMGFEMTDVTKPHEGKKVMSTKRVMEKWVSHG